MYAKFQEALGTTHVNSELQKKVGKCPTIDRYFAQS